MTKENPTENDTKAKVRAILDKHGWMHFSVAGTRFGSNGTSDRIACKHGHMLAIETKGKGPPKGTPLQEKFLVKVREHGGTGWVINREMAYDGTFERMLIELEHELQRRLHGPSLHMPC